MSNIEVSNIGPVEHLVIPIPKDGGLVVLNGDNDLGKSEIIDAVGSAISGKGKISVRRGSVQGELNGLGLTIRVSSKTMRSGELTISSLEGRFSIADLIEPGIKDPAAADAKRIKTLIQIVGIPADPELFYPLAGSKEAFEELVSTDTLKLKDVVDMAAAVKSDIEKRARAAEEEQKSWDAKVLAEREIASGVDVSQTDDEQQLSAAYAECVRHLSRRVTDAENIRQQIAAREEAKIKREEAGKNYVGPTLLDAQENVDKRARELIEAKEFVAQLEKQLALAKANVVSKTEALHQSRNLLATVAEHDRMIRTWDEQLAAPCPVPISQEELDQLAQNVEVAKEAMIQGALVRKAKEHLATAEKAAEKAAALSGRATKLRTAARAVDTVLSALVSKTGTPFEVESGRLLVQTDKGRKFYAELSHGTRSKMAIDVAIDGVGEGGGFTIDQEFFEGIAPARQKELADHIRGRKVLVLTARATDHKTITPEVM